MKSVIIVGAGKVGFNLAKLLSASHYHVIVMDKDKSICKRVAEELDLLAVLGDATEIDALGDIHAEDADYIVAATGKDEVNLAICLIAKKLYSCSRTIGRIVDPDNTILYHKQGVDATIDAATMAARTIMDIMPADGMRLFSIFESGDVSLVEFDIELTSPVCGKKVSDLSLPNDCLLITIIKNEKVDFPRGSTEINQGNKIMALVRPKSLNKLRNIFLGSIV